MAPVGRAEPGGGVVRPIALDDVPVQYRELVRAAQWRELARDTDDDRVAAADYRALVHAVPLRTLVGAACWVTAWRLQWWFR